MLYICIKIMCHEKILHQKIEHDQGCVEIFGYAPGRME
jgi:hypothetical protein